jgi:hypothetical protein
MAFQVAEISVAELVAAVTEHPGLSGYEIGEIIGKNPAKTNTRLHSICNARFPQIKKVKVDGLYAFYPFSYQVEPNPFEERTFSTVNLDGSPLRLYKVTAEDLASIERQLKRSKYSEFLEVIETLEIGEGVATKKIKELSTHRLRDTLRETYKGSRTFSVSDHTTYLAILRKT